VTAEEIEGRNEWPIPTFFRCTRYKTELQCLLHVMCPQMNSKLDPSNFVNIFVVCVIDCSSASVYVFFLSLFHKSKELFDVFDPSYLRIQLTLTLRRRDNSYFEEHSFLEESNEAKAPRSTTSHLVCCVSSSKSFRAYGLLRRLPIPSPRSVETTLRNRFSLFLHVTRDTRSPHVGGR